MTTRIYLSSVAQSSLEWDQNMKICEGNKECEFVFNGLYYERNFTAAESSNVEYCTFVKAFNNDNLTFEIKSVLSNSRKGEMIYGLRGHIWIIIDRSH